MNSFPEESYLQRKKSKEDLLNLKKSTFNNVYARYLAGEISYDDFLNAKDKFENEDAMGAELDIRRRMANRNMNAQREMPTPFDRPRNMVEGLYS
jgi:outer membrane protein TolC